jgi:uncharacterized protein YbbK (DUF523 family)
MEKIKMGISTCLLGEKVRYDGGHKLDRYITETLGQYFDYVPVCPEVEYGLPIPREALRLVGDPALPRLLTVRTGIDHTDGMLEWAERKLGELEPEELCGFIFKSRSPSSGLRGVKVYTASGMPSHSGTGIFANAFTRRNPLIPVTDDGRLHDPSLRETFIDSAFVYRRWQGLLKKGGQTRDLIDFHTDLKLLILAHSPKHSGSRTSSFSWKPFAFRPPRESTPTCSSMGWAISKNSLPSMKKRSYSMLSGPIKRDTSPSSCR